MSTRHHLFAGLLRTLVQVPGKYGQGLERGMQKSGEVQVSIKRNDKQRHDSKEFETGVEGEPSSRLKIRAHAYSANGRRR